MRKLLAALLPLSFIQGVSAHCPLCTAGAGAAAGVATYLGIDFAVIGVLIGGFSWALGSWTSKWFRKNFGNLFRYQNIVTTAVVYLSIVIPGVFWMPDATPLTLWMIGEYGTTISLNNFLIGSVAGGLAVLISPEISKKISEKRGETVPFQGMSLNLLLLILLAIAAQLVF